MKWLLYLLFFEDPGKGGMEVSWPPRLPMADSGLGKLLFVVGGAAVVALIWYAYRREPSYVDPGRKRLLASLRTAAALLLLFILTGAFLEMHRTEISRGTVALLIDRSASMGIADRRSSAEDLAAGARMLGQPLAAGSAPSADARKTINATTRSQYVDRVLADGALAKLAERYDVLAYSFGEAAEVRPLDLVSEGGRLTLKPGVPNEQATQLGSALRDVAARLKGRMVTAIVPITDGAWNRGEDPVLTARDLHLPLHAVGVGLPESKDIEIPFLFAENVVFKGDTFPLHVRIKQRGYTGQTARLVVKRDGQSVKDEAVVFEGPSEFTKVIDITPQESGTFAWSAEITAFEDEVTAENNIKTKSGLRVIDDKIRVLVVDDSPRWEFRFLKAVLDADKKRIAPSYVLRQIDKDLLRVPGSGFLPHFPASADELRKYNLVVLGDVVAEFFTRAELANLQQWVRDEAGALIIIAGPGNMPGAYAGTPVQDLLPVDLVPQDKVTPDTEASRPATSDFKVRLTEEGRRSAIFRFAVDPFDNDRLWERASKLFWYARSGRLKPGATALAVHAGEENRAGGVPIIASQRFGKGQVLYLASDETWRWRYKPGAEPHRRFWGQAVSALALAHLMGGSNRIQIETDNQEYAVGDEVKVIARVLDQRYAPSTAPTVTASLSRGGLDQEDLVLSAQDGQPGVYAGVFRPKAEGPYRIAIGGGPVASGSDGGDSAEHRITAVTPRLEFDDPAMRREVLQQVADAGGGDFVPLHDLSRLLAKLSSKEAVLEPRREERALWNAPGLVVLISLLLGAEWLIRKRSDLL